MSAEIIAIGTELLLGEIVDTNSAHIARQLRTIGLDLLYTSSVGDNEERIAAVIRHAMARSTVVITTGGLGPTVDDKTREAVALATGKPLVFDETLMRQIEARFQRWGRTPSENNRRQAFRPQGSLPLENPVGTAPCFIVDSGEAVVIALPGVPREMSYLLEHAVLPFLRQRFNLNSVIKSRTLHIAGLGESVIDTQVGDLETLTNPTVGLNAHYGVVDLRITAKAVSIQEAETLIAPIERTARDRLGPAVFGADGETLEAVVLQALASVGKTVAVAESGTAGRLGGRLAQADEGRGIFRGAQLETLTQAQSDLGTVAAAAMSATGATIGLACAIYNVNGETEVVVSVVEAGNHATQRRGFGGHADVAADWATHLALDTLRRLLLKAD